MVGGPRRRRATRRELAAIYAAYVELRDAGGRCGPRPGAHAAAIAALRADPEGWGRPVFVYGFDDLTAPSSSWSTPLARAERGHRRRHLRRQARAQRPCRPADRARATSSGQRSRAAAALRRRATRQSPTLRHLDRNLFEPERRPDRARRRPACCSQRRAPRRGRGDRGRDRAASERRLRAGRDRVVVRRPDAGGALLASVLGGARHPGGAGGFGSAAADLRRHLADRPLPRRRRRDRRRGAAHPPALRPVAGAGPGRQRRAARCAAATPRA